MNACLNKGYKNKPDICESNVNCLTLKLLWK